MKKLAWILALGLALGLLLPACQDGRDPDGIYLDEEIEITVEPEDIELPDEAPTEAEPIVSGAGASVLDTFAASFSAKEFTDDAVGSEYLQQILECGAKSPSAQNQQPWHFTVSTNKEINAQIAQAATDGTVLIVVSGLIEPPNEGVNPTFDCALATQSMVLAAQSLGLGAHIYTGPIARINDSSGTLGTSLEIPEGYQAVSAILIGYVENEADAIASASERNPLKVNYVE